jgi:nucleoside 2-deoxyribosyltransferase
MSKQKVYLSGGFKSNWQEKLITELEEDFIFLNPRSHELNDSSQYWAWDVHSIRQCDIVFAYMDSDNPSGYGLALEVGLALGLNKTIVLVDDRSKHDPKFEMYFKIVHESANVVLPSLEDGMSYLRKFRIV